MEFSKSIFSPVKALKYLFKEPVTIDNNDIYKKPRVAADRYRGFHINKQDDCIGCGTCSEICPTEAITMVAMGDREIADGKTNELPMLDYGRCSFCGLCIDICTTESLRMTKQYIYTTTDVNTFLFIPDELGISNTYYPNGYSRDKHSELLDLERYDIEEVPHKDRNRSFIELIKGFSKEMAFAEASRCVECGICTFTCPASMNIPEYINSIYDDKLDEGLELLYRTNPLPNVCGRICTHNCETVCVLSNRGESISIRWLKRYIIDNISDIDYKKMIIDPITKQVNKKVAIVGSGPAGLSAAYYLRTLGYEITVFESKELAGGVIRYGAPEYRLPDYKVDTDINVIKQLGIDIKTSTAVGRDVTLKELQSEYDAVFIATGFWLPKKLNIPNKDHKDVITSVEFLAKSRDYTRGIGPMPDIHENVIVIGGGDVSFDVARTLVRLQNEKYNKNHVQFVARKSEEYLAASFEEIVEAKQENVLYNLNASPKEIQLDSKGNICGVTAEKCDTLVIDGKIKTLTRAGEVCCIKGTQVYFAVGSKPEYSYLYDSLNLDASTKKITVNDDGQVEGNEWLFAGGDIVNGPDIITAIEDGHRAAKGIDKYLMK